MTRPSAFSPEVRERAVMVLEHAAAHDSFGYVPPDEFERAYFQSNDAGNNNTAIGAKALKKSLGTKNIAIGFQAGVSLVNGNNNIYIGNQGAGDESQTIRIGTAQGQTFIAGINAASVSGAQVMVNTTTGQLGIVTSSARYKQDIAPMGTRSEKVLDLRPVTFAYKDDARAVTHYGLIAEEVATVYPDLVTRTASGEVQTVRFQELIPMLLNELQRQRQEFQQALQSRQKEIAELPRTREPRSSEGRPWGVGHTKVNLSIRGSLAARNVGSGRGGRI